MNKCNFLFIYCFFFIVFLVNEIIQLKSFLLIQENKTLISLVHLLKDLHYILVISKKILKHCIYFFQNRFIIKSFFLCLLIIKVQNNYIFIGENQLFVDVLVIGIIFQNLYKIISFYSINFFLNKTSSRPNFISFR